jgi:hypothetical protein
MSQSTPQEPPADAGYERRDLEPRHIAIFSAGGTVVLLLAAGLAYWIVQSATKRQASLQTPLPPAQAREAEPEPRLQVQGFNELREMRHAEDMMLNSYGWIDREQGLVRIPVERAMKIFAESKKEKTPNSKLATKK